MEQGSEFGIGISGISPLAKILLVEDDISLCESVKDWFASQNHVTDVVHTANEGRDFLSTYKYDLIILDWNLPDGDGLELLSDFRNEGGTTPVLMLTGKSDIDDIERGLDSGADDYLTKPFNKKELAARSRALLRRLEVKPEQSIAIDDITLDPVQHRISRAEKVLKLSPRDFALLEFFLRNPDQVFSAEAILDRVWRADQSVGPEAVRTHIKRLRRQLDDPDKPSRIETIHRVGYKFLSRIE